MGAIITSLHIALLITALSLIQLASCQANDIRKPPNIIEPNSPKSLYFSANSLVTVDCKAEGIPEPTYRWEKDGQPITFQDNKYILFDSTSGQLTIKEFTKREEGTFKCIASNVFDNPNGRVTATSFAPPIKIFQTRVEKFTGDENFSGLQTAEYSYAVLKCSNKGEVVGNDININWYESEKSKDISMDQGRRFVDANGNLHFSYTLMKDTTTNFIYLCGISSTSDKVIRLGIANYLNVTRVPNPTAIKPQLQYSNSGVQGIRFGKARLECVFSGYDPIEPHVPVTHWFDDSGVEIRGDSTKYTLSEDRRALTVNNLQEEDERSYFCQGKNSAGDSNMMDVFLNVTSAPIFLASGAPKDQTVVENVDVVINCDARSASNEEPPIPPTWYINGIKMGQHTDPTKYSVSSDKKKLTIMKVKKATDIQCVQCEVTNSIDTTWGDACLNVILPIKIERRPLEKQEIDHGDVIDLTVTASGDPSTPLSYRWEINNITYVTETPPFMTQDLATNLAYINTSELTEKQYNTLGGSYKRYVFQPYETKVVETIVVLKDKPVVEPAVVAASIDMWIIGLIIGIIFLLIVILIIIFVICRKKQEGDYNVDKKETGAGLDPKKELKNKGFNEYSRPEYDDYPDKKPRGDLEYDDVPIGGDDESLGEYGDEDDQHFNEDGSFIGIYQKKQPSSKAHESAI